MERVLRVASHLLLGWIAAGLWLGTAQAAELKPETILAYDRYIQLVEMRMSNGRQNGNFLYLDSLPDGVRQQIAAQVRAGDPYIEQLSVLENGAPIRVPLGLIHHWIGIAFIPGATYSQAIAVLLDYDKQADFYKPDVRRSKLLETDGNKSKIYLQYYKKSLVTVVLNANFDSEVRAWNHSGGEIRSHSTRIAELEDADKPDGKELPVGKDHGYMWRLSSYWRLDERDGGVYIEIESVALSRRVPPAIAWIVTPVVRHLSKAVVYNLLMKTRNAVACNIVPKGQFCSDAGAKIDENAEFAGGSNAQP